jgi:hypothetical protein
MVMMSRVRRSRVLRYLALASVVCPLLATGPCVTIAEQSVINGFFDAVTPILVDHARQELGLPPLTTTDTTAG